MDSSSSSSSSQPSTVPSSSSSSQPASSTSSLASSSSDSGERNIATFDSDYRLTIPAILNPSETYDVAVKVLSAVATVIPADPATLERKQCDKLAELTQGLATAVVAQIRQFIDDAEAKARARRSRRGNEGEYDTPEPPPEPPSE